MQKAPPSIELDYEPGKLSVRGSLTRDTVNKASDDASCVFNSCNQLIIDLAGVEHTDSAGLALLLAWTRRAKAQAVHLSFVNVPDRLKDLGRVSGLDDILVLR